MAESVATSALLQGALILSGVLSARLLGPENRGHLALLILIPSLIAQIGGLGLPLAVTQFVARDPAARREIVHVLVRPALLQSLLLTALHACVVAALVLDRGTDVRIAGVITLATIPAQFLLGYSLAVLQGEQRFLPFNVLRLAPVVLYALALVAAWTAGIGNLVDVAALATLPFVLSALGGAFVIRRDFMRRDRLAEPRGITFRSLLSFGVRSFLGSVSPIDSFRLDQLIVAALFSPALLGVYVAGAAFMNLPRFVGQSIGMVAAPHVAAQPTPEERRRGMWSMFGVSFVCCGLAAAGLVLTIPVLLPWFFGTEFAGGVAVAQILVVGSFLLSLRRTLTDAARGAGHPGIGGIAEVIGLLSLGPALGICVPSWGLEGVAAALTVSAGVSLSVLILGLTTEFPTRLLLGTRARLSWRSAAGFAGTAVAAAAIGAALAYAPSQDALLFALGLATLGLATVGAVRHSVARGHDLLSPLALGAVFYALVFGVGAAYFWTMPVGTSRYVLLYDRHDLVAAVWLGTAAWMFFAWGYLLRPLAPSRRGLERVTIRPFQSSRVPVAVPVVILLALGWTARGFLVYTGHYFHTIASGAVASSNAGWIAATVATLPIVAVAYLGACLYLRVAESKRGWLVFKLLLASEVLWALPSGTRANLVSLGVMLVALHYYGRGRLPWRAVAAFVVLVVFFLMPFGLAYRSDAEPYQTNPQQALTTAARQFTHGGVGKVYADGLSATLTRLSPIASVATVLHEGRGQNVLTASTSAKWIAGAFVPRVALPSKSDPGRFGNQFGREFGILRENDYITSIAPTEVSELYLIAGVLGVIALMPLVGLAYRLISDVLGDRARNPVALALYSVAAWSVLHEHGVVVALGLVGTIKTLLVLGLFLVVSVRIAALGGREPARAAQGDERWAVT